MNKVKVNKNFIWAKTFVNQLCEMGVKDVCISPGSRSTPLTLAFAEEKKIKSYIILDERTSAFFALGIAKATKNPVAVVTTSGTATAELYPAIIEAYQSRVPLIICTADRPPHLINSGANQTINQRNIYRNHIRWFKNVSQPGLSIKNIEKLKNTAVKAFEICAKKDAGPVHLNFPFDKPLEPKTFTDEIESENLNSFLSPYKNTLIKNENPKLSKREEKKIDKIVDEIKIFGNGLIVVGPNNYDKNFRKSVKKLSQITGFPIFADGISHIRFKINKSGKFIIDNYDAFLRSENFGKKFQPEIILQFGRAVTSLTLQNYLNESLAKRFLINEFGDWVDASKKSRLPFKINPTLFCDTVVKRLEDFNHKKTNKKWTTGFIKANELTKEIKLSLLEKVTFPDETKIINEIVAALKTGTQIFTGNSLPVRDFDNFISNTEKDFKVFFNRGASGIDGITSTALGIASNKKATILITGDLSFIHDLNALLIAKQNNIPLTVIVINNNGGGIFNLLPVFEKSRRFVKYFTTPQNPDIAAIVKSFGMKYHHVKKMSDLKKNLTAAINEKSFSVIEITTDPVKSKETRTRFWKNTAVQIDKAFE